MMTDPVFAEALTRIQSLLTRAHELNLKEPTAMTLATANKEARPSARVVLLRGCDEHGFVFYTNSLSRKGHELRENPLAALCFYWEELVEQARVEGTVEIVTDEESDVYWQGRPRESQIGAWASQQSQELDSMETLRTRVEELTRQYEGKPVPRPQHWHGFRVVPDRIEFWEGQTARLHKRSVYVKEPAGWTSSLLYP